MEAGREIKLIIAGSRSFDNYEKLVGEVNLFIHEIIGGNIFWGCEVVSGHACGADLLGELYAVKHCFERKIFLPDWVKHGKSAGVIRNKEMAAYATHCIVFWDGKSRGTKNMIEEAKKKNLVLKVVNY